MLTLYALRHAKAVGASSEGDALRDLAERGRTEATCLGAFMAEQGWRPSLALVSSAARTTQTFEHLQSGFARSGVTGVIPARFEASLYNATATQILGQLRGLAPGVASALVVGHNPGIAEVAAALSRYGDASEIRALRERFPTCALAVVTFDCDDWRDAIASGGRLDDFVIPEHLEAPK